MIMFSIKIDSVKRYVFLCNLKEKYLLTTTYEQMMGKTNTNVVINHIVRISIFIQS